MLCQLLLGGVVFLDSVVSFSRGELLSPVQMVQTEFDKYDKASQVFVRDSVHVGCCDSRLLLFLFFSAIRS